MTSNSEEEGGEKDVCFVFLIHDTVKKTIFAALKSYKAYMY